MAQARIERISNHEPADTAAKNTHRRQKQEQLAPPAPAPPQKPPHTVRRTAPLGIAEGEKARGSMRRWNR